MFTSESVPGGCITCVCVLCDVLAVVSCWAAAIMNEPLIQSESTAMSDSSCRGDRAHVLQYLGPRHRALLACSHSDRPNRM